MQLFLSSSIDVVVVGDVFSVVDQSEGALMRSCGEAGPSLEPINWMSTQFK